MNNPASDTVRVRLTAAGRKAADGGELRINGAGAKPLKFSGDIAQDVPVTAWSELSRTAPFGEPWFELAPAQAVVAAVPAAQTPTKSADAPAATNPAASAK